MSVYVSPPWKESARVNVFIWTHTPAILFWPKSEVVIMLCCQLCSACYSVLQMKRSPSAINPVTTENADDSCAPTINYWLESDHYASLSTISLFYSITNEEQEKYLCSHHGEYRRFPFTNVGKPSRWIDTLGCQQKNGTKVSPWCVHCTYILWYAKRQVSGWSNVDQWKNQAHNLSCYRVMLF